MIPDEAVEAANRAVFEKFNGMIRPALVRVVLEAAAPHLMAAAWHEGYDRAESDHYGTGFWTKRLRDNPYGKTNNAD
jgi:hypothetical protein